MNKGTGYLSWLRSKDKIIIDLLEQQAALVAKATTTLVDLTSNLDRGKQFQSQMRDLEHEGNQLVRKVFVIIDETFVTPLDREDISRISQAIEKILNHTRRIADNIILFNIGKPSSDILQLVTVLRDVSQKVSDSISKIRSLKKASAIIEQGNSISKYEGGRDHLWQSDIGTI